MEEFIAAEPALSGSIKLTTGSVEGLPLLPEGGLPSCHTRMPLPGIHVFFYGFPIKTFGNDITPVPSGGIRKSRLSICLFTNYQLPMGSFTMPRVKSLDLLNVLKQKQGANFHHKVNCPSIWQKSP